VSGLPGPWSDELARGGPEARTASREATAKHLAMRAELAAAQGKNVVISPEMALRLATWLSEGR
jgi:hypothetical protein